MEPAVIPDDRFDAGVDVVAEPSALRAEDPIGALIVAGFSALTACGLWLSFHGDGAVGAVSWLCGQLVLAVAFLQWFVVLHEAGHGVLFAGRRKNVVVGHVAGFITLIPFHAWQPIHQKHHIWTGWQDRDPTTMALVPRQLSGIEKSIINGCWKTGVPLFSLLYRVNNFWNVPRLLTLLPKRAVQQRVVVNTVAMVVVWTAVVLVWGPLVVLQACGLAMVLGFMLQEPIMLSQHTHIPLRLAGDTEVAPFSPAQQLPFTRSLRFPAWISTFVLLHFDAHELHHEHPNVPGWRLRALDRHTPNDFPAWRWIRMARRIPAEVFLFSNRERSGLDV
jgi:omega-6 fatty acid desaturase (delta-12 desaturase)